MKKLFYFLPACILMASCGSEVPTLSTSPATMVNDTTYNCGGNVLEDGGANVTERGLTVSLSANPTVDDPNDVTIAIGSGLGSFSMDLFPFYAGNTYHVRAYAKNSVGVGYGNEITVTPGQSTSCNVIHVTNDITTPTTWTTGNVYVVNSIAVKSTLTIDPGVVVKFQGNNVNGNLDVQSGGRIIANGTATNRIVFTSLNDDSYCGDSNGDGSATAASKGDWNSIALDGGTNNSFAYCDFFYGGGYNGYVVHIGVTSAAFTFDNCTFAHTKPSISDYAAFHGGSYMKDPATSIFTNNAFYDNDRPIFLNVWYTLDPSNIFHNPANPSQKNKYNGIFMWTEGATSGTTQWLVTEVPYVVGGWVQAAGSATLIVGSNVIVKFATVGSSLTFNDANNANLSGSAVFTSLRDDARGGDTNGDGSLTTPAEGDWDGVRINTTWVSNNVFYDNH